MKSSKKYIIVIVVISFVLFTAINTSQSVAPVTPAKNVTGIQGNIFSGYVNLSAYGSELDLWLVVAGMFHGIINNSTLNVSTSVPVTVMLQLANDSLQVPFKSVGISVSSITVTDSMIPGPIGPKMQWVRLLPGGYEADSGSWDGQTIMAHPGIHHLFLNFTVIPYSILGIYKFSGAPDPLSFEWNVTVVG